MQRASGLGGDMCNLSDVVAVELMDKVGPDGVGFMADQCLAQTSHTVDIARNKGDVVRHDQDGEALVETRK